MSDPSRSPFNETVRLSLFMATVLLAFIAQIPAVIVAGSALCGLYAWVARSRRAARWHEVALAAGACLLFFPAFANLHHGASPIYYFFATLAAFFAAQAVSRKPAAALMRALGWIYWAAVSGIAWVLYTYWGYKEPFGMIIEGSSTNGIPAYLIVLQIALSLCTYAATGRLPVLTPLITGAVAFYGAGRGSLVVAGLIIGISFLLNLMPTAGPVRPGRWVWRIGFLAGFALLTVFLALYGDEFLDLVTRYTKLSVGLVDTNRLEIWDQYSAQLNPYTLLFGADYAGTVIDYEYRGNPHIAYIRTHSFFGLPATLLAMLSPLLVLFVRKSLTAKLVFFSFISLAALRAASEPIFFPTLLDFFYFLYFFVYFNHIPVPSAAARTASLESHRA